MNLYQANELARLESHIDHETGEIDIDSFNGAQIALRDKQLAVVAYLKNEIVNIDMLDNAIKELTSRKKAMQSRHDNLKEYLFVNMLHHKISEITASDFTFTAKIKKNPAKLIIDDAGLIPKDLYFYPVAPEPYPYNAKIKDLLKSGKNVDGARLQQDERLEIK